jgi:hypothetical protein
MITPQVTEAFNQSDPIPSRFKSQIYFFFFNGATAHILPWIFSSSPPDIPVLCSSPPSSYVQQQRVPPDVEG